MGWGLYGPDIQRLAVNISALSYHQGCTIGSGESDLFVDVPIKEQVGLGQWCAEWILKWEWNVFKTGEISQLDFTNK